MASKSERSREFFAMFGTPFEELDESEAASKKPLSIENQIVTDEKGRRRFHGAFTGGFSAGFFNTVGTKEGWAPSTFKSTRSKREGQQTRRPEDFMDSEDLGEYGIAPRKIQTTQAFTENAERSATGEKRRFAGEATADTEAVADRLSDLIRPVSDSIGVKLMRSMGWRPGKGVGSAQTALIRERAKDAVKTYGCELPPGDSANVDELAAVELEAMAPGFQFAPSDVDFVRFETKSDLHGLGYKGLDVERHLKSARNLEKGSTLKTSAQQKKGIRGQAFGVGAFEDDDDDLFATEDLSNYDFALGGTDSREKQVSSTGDFVPASKHQLPRQFFPPPKLPRDYTPAVPSASTLKERPKAEVPERRDTIPKYEEQSRNALQRANALDESHSVWSLVAAADRRRIEAIKAGKRIEAPASRVQIGEREEPNQQEKGRVQPKEAARAEEIQTPFQDDPKKRARFQDFVNYLKRGLCPPQPVDLTEWDWEVEQIEFRKLLPSELVAAEDDARSRQKPLAGTKLAAVFGSGFKSKFTKGEFLEEDLAESSGKGGEDEDKIKAVQMKMFGAMTREKHEWHPDRNLCKRFNLPNPYPDSRVVGVPYLKKETKPGFFTLNFETVTTTAVAVDESSKPKETSVVRQSAEASLKLEKPSVGEDNSQQPSTSTAPAVDSCQVEEDERPPISLFKAIFAQTSSSSSESEDEKEAEPETVRTFPQQESVPVVHLEPSDADAKVEKAERSFSRFSVARPPVETAARPIEVELDTNEAGGSADQDHVEPGLYGPVLPPETSEISLPPTSVIRRHKHEKKKRHRHRSHKKKGNSSDRKHRKHKKEKKKKSKRYSGSSDTETSEEESSSGRSR